MVIYYLVMSTDGSVLSDSKRLVVFGASGGVGGHVVEQALSRGHEVVAVARSAGKLTVRDAKLTAVAGELSDRDAIGAAVRGADGVISALGPGAARIECLRRLPSRSSLSRKTTLRVPMRVRACLHCLQFAAVRCSSKNAGLQLVSASRRSLPPIRADF